MGIALPTTGAGEKLAYSLKEAAEALGIGYTSLHLAVKRGDIPCVVIGRRRLIARAALEHLLAGGLPQRDGRAA